MGNVTDTVTFNEFGELELRQVEHNGSPLFTEDLTHDGVGRIDTAAEDILGTAQPTMDYIYETGGTWLEQVDWVDAGGAVVGSSNHYSGSKVVGVSSVEQGAVRR